MESIDGLNIVDRQKTLINWLEVDCGLSSISLQPMTASASFRRYFRIATGKTSLVVMDAPPFKEDCQSYIAIANALRKMKLHTPHIFAADLEQGFLLITDFGDTTYLQKLNAKNADHLYDLALLALTKLQACDLVPHHPLPYFQESLMWQEWAWHKEWFLNKLLGLNLGLLEKELDNCYDLIVTSALNQPQVFMHRDFHSANLMVLPQDEVGILDFQDAFIGPITYDLVSLLRDCYIDWPNEWVKKWVETYRQHLQTLKVLQDDVSETQFMHWFDWMGVQRHLKALFTFARKKIRDNEPAFLAHVLRTLNYLIAESESYQPLAPLHEYANLVVKPTFLKLYPDLSEHDAKPNEDCVVPRAGDALPSTRNAPNDSRGRIVGENINRAMILAAGQGTRMGELTSHTPKPLLLVAGKYLIEYALLSLKEAGILEIIINISSFGEQIKEALGCGKRYGLKILYSEEKERLETGGGIFKALPLLGSEPFLVMSSDIITSYPLRQLRDRPLKGLAHLVMVKNPPYHPQGDFGLQDGVISLEKSETLTFANMAMIHPALFSGCEGGHFRLATKLLIPAIQKGKVTGEFFQGTWHNIGTPSDLLEVNKAFV